MNCSVSIKMFACKSKMKENKSREFQYNAQHNAVTLPGQTPNLQKQIFLHGLDGNLKLQKAPPSDSNVTTSSCSVAIESLENIIFWFILEGKAQELQWYCVYLDENCTIKVVCINSSFMEVFPELDYNHFQCSTLHYVS